MKRKKTKTRARKRRVRRNPSAAHKQSTSARAKTLPRQLSLPSGRPAPTKRIGKRSGGNRMGITAGRVAAAEKAEKARRAAAAKKERDERNEVNAWAKRARAEQKAEKRKTTGRKSAQKAARPMAKSKAKAKGKKSKGRARYRYESHKKRKSFVRVNPGVPMMVKSGLMSVVEGVGAGLAAIAITYAANKMATSGGRTAVLGAGTVVGGLVLGAFSPLAGGILAGSLAIPTAVALLPPGSVSGVFGPSNRRIATVVGPSGRMISGVSSGTPIGDVPSPALAENDRRQWLVQEARIQRIAASMSHRV